LGLLELLTEIVNNDRGVKQARDLPNPPTSDRLPTVRQTDLSNSQSPLAPGFIYGNIQVVLLSLLPEGANHRRIHLGPGSRLSGRFRPWGGTAREGEDPDLRSSGSFDGALDLPRQSLPILFVPRGGGRLPRVFASRYTDRADQKSRKLQF